MLIELHGLDDEQAARLMEIYEESNRENIECFFRNTRVRKMEC